MLVYPGCPGKEAVKWVSTNITIMLAFELMASLAGYGAFFHVVTVRPFKTFLLCLDRDVLF